MLNSFAAGRVLRGLYTHAVIHLALSASAQ
jgi:hypothetical protein